MISKPLSKKLLEEIISIDNLKVFEMVSEKKRYSRDFFDYSPILLERLENCCADLVVRPSSIDAVIAVAKLCNRHNIPLTIRGSGTGNYGQCVPLKGGIVMHMIDINKIRSFDSASGEVVVETGCLLADLEAFLSPKGRQLKLLPSTWRTASVGGFIAGGSGGIGSVRWGFLRDPGHLLGLEIITVDQQPKQIQLNECSSKPLNHAYGTNGIITALTLSTTDFVAWHEMVIDCEDWNKAVLLLKRCSRANVKLLLCSLIETTILQNLPSWSGDFKGKNRLLILVDSKGMETIQILAKDSQAECNVLGPEKTSTNGLRELSWNHTTLHMRSHDSQLTYLQMLLPEPEIEAINQISNKWGSNISWHLEAVLQQGAQRIAALPIIRWQGQQLLEELMSDCQKAGAVLFNPHVLTVEDGGLGVIDVDQVKAKQLYDPKGLMNPGKLKGWKS